MNGNNNNDSERVVSAMRSTLTTLSGEYKLRGLRSEDRQPTSRYQWLAPMQRNGMYPHLPHMTMITSSTIACSLGSESTV